MTFRPRLQVLVIINLCYFTQLDDHLNTNEITSLQKRLMEKRVRNLHKQQLGEKRGGRGVMTISKGLSERCEELETVVSLKRNLLNKAFFIVFSRLLCSNYQ